MKEIKLEKTTTWHIINAIEKSGIEKIKLLHIFEVDYHDSWVVSKKNMDLIFISKILMVNFGSYDLFNAKIHIDENEVIIYIKK